MNHPGPCVLCGNANRHEVRMRLTAWQDGTYGNVPRCDKTADCYARARLDGEEWVARVPLDFSPERRDRIGDPLPMPKFEVRR